MIRPSKSLGVPGWLRVAGILMAIGLAPTPPARAAASEAQAEPVEIEVDGTGWLQDRRLARALLRLQPDPSTPTLDANGVEDAAFFLFSALSDEGYLKPKISGELTRSDGEVITHEFEPQLMELLPRPLEVTKARFVVEEGVQYQFEEVEVTGNLTGITAEEVREQVLPPGGGLFGRGDRVYSPSVLNRGVGGVADILTSRGYAQARVEAGEPQMNDETGHVRVTVDVQPGPLWRVAEVAIEGQKPEDVELPDIGAGVGEPWTVSWEQDAMEAIRQAYYAKGYPDVQVRAARDPAAAKGGEQAVEVTFSVTPGPNVTVQEIRFAGDHGVNDSVLRRRVPAEPGDPLDPLLFDAARYRLSRLGAFRSVRLSYEPEEGAERAAVYTLVPLPEWEVHLLAGYGSYEQLRGGVEVRRNNVLDRAHQARFEVVQSFKSTSGELTYTVPELFGEMIDGSAQLFGLRREELAFERQEYGGTIGLRRRRVPWIDAEGTLSYTYQSLRNRENELTTRDVDTSETIAASIQLGLNRDRRDNPLRPQRGYRWFVQTEVAAEAFGGEVDYQRLELGLSYHTGWGARRWVHASLTHGVVLTLGAKNDLELPVNKRFYPGGDSSVRGYQLGEAAPRGPDGRFIGAKTTTLLNVEFEQTLIGQFTGVVFVDALGMSAALSGYPIDEYLVSVGLGLRYQTIIGPVRLEYGHNLNRRDQDPAGTLHFSLGFPF